LLLVGLLVFVVRLASTRLTGLPDASAGAADLDEASVLRF